MCNVQTARPGACIALAISTIDPSDLLIVPANQFRAYMASFVVICLDQGCDRFDGVVRVRDYILSSMFRVISLCIYATSCLKSAQSDALCRVL